MSKRMTGTVHGVGRVVQFTDTWRGRRATCLLLGEGLGPEGESVRIVGFPQPGEGFTVAYVKSYSPGLGNGRLAYRYLTELFGAPLDVIEIGSEDGIGFHRHLLDDGLVASISVDRPGYDQRTGLPVDEVESSPCRGPKP